MKEEDKEKLIEVMANVREAMMVVSALLVELAKLRGGEGYDFECNLTVKESKVTGTMGGKAFNLVDGKKEFLPDIGLDVGAKKPAAGMPAAAAAVVEDILKKLGIGGSK